AFYGIFRFKWPDLSPHAPLLFTGMAVYLATFIVGFARFGRYPSLHLNSAKIAAYLQGFFFFALFAWGFESWLFHFSLLFGMAAWTEEIIVLFMLKELKSDARGLYWVLKAKSAA